MALECGESIQFLDAPSGKELGSHLLARYAEATVRAMRKDANHADVGDGLRALGWSVLDLAQYGVSVDYAVSKPGFAALLEVKDGKKPPSARKLTESEQKLRDRWQGPWVTAISLEDAACQLLTLWRGWNR